MLYIQNPSLRHTKPNYMYSNMRYIQIPFRNPKFKKGTIRTCFAHKHHSDAQNANMHLFEHALHTKLIIPAHQIEKPIHSRMFHMLNHHSETPNFKTYYNDLFEHVVRTYKTHYSDAHIF